MLGNVSNSNGSGSECGSEKGNSKAGSTENSCNCCKMCKCNGRLNDIDNEKKKGKEEEKKCKCCRACKKSFTPCTRTTNYKSNLGYAYGRNRGGCECAQQQNIMLFLQSIRQVVSNKKGLSDLADLLLQCTCEGVKNGSGDTKSGIASVFKMILEKIKECADGRPAEEKQSDLCALIHTLTEMQNKEQKTRHRGGQNGNGCGKNQSCLETQQTMSCLVKQILELSVKYCSDRSIDLRNMLCKVLSNDVCNEELTSLCRTICQYLEADRNVICDHVRKETGGRIVNASCLPEVRGNIKYPSNTDYDGGSFTLPLPEDCDEKNIVNRYRRKNVQRECCVQIDGGDIDNTMKGINQTLPNGIELCRKGTIDHDSDVFILKMGKKDASSDKKGLIEIELKTPKGPTGGRAQTVSRDTQVDEDMLKERVGGASKDSGGKSKGKKGKGKGKKGKKGKK